MSTDYARHQEALARQLGGNMPAPGQRPTLDQMRRASGISDEDLLRALVELGIRPDGLLLLSLVPMVAVAWADGEVQPAERDAILLQAEGRGIVPGTPPYVLLERWLRQKPPDRLLHTWAAFVAAVIEEWDDDKTARFRRQVGELARMVAKVAGGVLGIGAVSAAEAAVIARVEAAFDR